MRIVGQDPRGEPPGFSLLYFLTLYFYSCRVLRCLFPVPTPETGLVYLPGTGLEGDHRLSLTLLGTDCSYAETDTNTFWSHGYMAARHHSWTLVANLTMASFPFSLSLHAL